MQKRFVAGIALAVAVLLAVPALAIAVGGNHRREKLPLTLAGHDFLYRANDFTVGGTRVHDLALIHQYSANGRTLTFTQVSGPHLGAPCEVVTPAISEVEPGIYFVRWIEQNGAEISGVYNLKTGHIEQWFVLPPSATGASQTITVSPTGTYTPYTGPAPARCTNG